jgi:hypothetical protein
MTDFLSREEELDINNFSYDREYIRRQKFIMTNSCYLPVEFIKFAEKILGPKLMPIRVGMTSAAL